VSALLLTAALLLGAEPPADHDMEVDTSPDRHLGPARDISVLAFPMEALMHATSGSPQLAVEVRVDVGHGVALGVRPIGVWYLPSRDHKVHGGGIGGALTLHWYTRRALSGPYLGLVAGDVEAFLDGERGRIVGASTIFGYALSYDSGALIHVGVGLGYWHKMGVVDNGIQWPELLSFRVATGWGFGTPEYE